MTNAGRNIYRVDLMEIGAAMAFFKHELEDDNLFPISMRQKPRLPKTPGRQTSVKWGTWKPGSQAL